MPENIVYYGGEIEPGLVSERPQTRQGRRALRRAQNLQDLNTIRRGGPQAQKALISYINRGRDQAARDLGSVLLGQAFALTLPETYSGFNYLDQIMHGAKTTVPELGTTMIYTGIPSLIYEETDDNPDINSRARIKEQEQGEYTIPKKRKVVSKNQGGRLIKRKYF